MLHNKSEATIDNTYSRFSVTAVSGSIRTQKSAGKVPPVTAYIAIGSNDSKPLEQVNKSVEYLCASKRLQLLRVSSWYLNAAVGHRQQPDFINGVAELQTTLTALELLDCLQGIEQQLGRTRPFANAPRCIDLDLLLFGRMVIELPRLTLPHPRMTKRDFVIYPLLEIAPQLRLPNNVPLCNYVQTVQKRPDMRILCDPESGG